MAELDENIGGRSRSNFLRPLPIALLVLGIVARLLPLLEPRGRALSEFVTEDGYLMLTIARNLALGHGMSIEDGQVATNGTQPLMTFVYAACYALVGGDKVWGVVLVQCVALALTLATVFAMYRLGQLLLARTAAGDLVAATAAALWFAATLSTRHTQNGLETGAAALSVVWIALFFLRRLSRPERIWSFVACAELGGLIAVAFWVRNDAVLLAAAVCSLRVVPGLRGVAPGLSRRLAEVACVGSTALAGAAPWLVYNVLRFGHLMPISGVSEQYEAKFAANLPLVLPALAEYTSVVLPIPEAIEHKPIVWLGCGLFVALWLALAYRWARAQAPSVRSWLAVLTLWGALLCTFYGLWFGAGYFMSRYLFPLSPFLALISLAMLDDARRFVAPARELALRAALGSAALVLLLGLHTRVWRNGTNNGHFQVVDWVSAHVPETAWVAAPQTGTLGYFHDRTRNLDGKVSPAALAARVEGRTFRYVLDMDVSYLADWVGIETWVKDSELTPYFVVRVLDPARNLVVLERVTKSREESG